MIRFLALLFCLITTAASAHETTRSYVRLDRSGTEVDLRIRVAFRDIEVLRSKSGAPAILLHGRVAERASALGVGRIHLSLTHAAPLALASVIAESSAPVHGEGQ